jgi:hypothetical protein
MGRMVARWLQPGGRRVWVASAALLAVAVLVVNARLPGDPVRAEPIRPPVVAAEPPVDTGPARVVARRYLTVFHSPVLPDPVWRDRLRQYATRELVALTPNRDAIPPRMVLTRIRVVGVRPPGVVEVVGVFTGGRERVLLVADGYGAWLVAQHSPA